MTYQDKDFLLFSMAFASAVAGTILIIYVLAS